MKEDIGLILFNTVNYYLNNVIAKTLIKVKHCHEKKLVTLVQQKRNLYGESNILFIHCTIYNYWSYNLLVNEEKVLWFRLDQHIQTTLNCKNLHTEFEYFYQNITNDILHLSEGVIKLKTKLHYTYEKYSHIKVPYKYQGTLTLYDEITAL